uniref:EAL domain-containing protein n=1 Tax=Lysinibacillus sp. GbtcB16 TaxID=2824761 RepID=UPI001C2F3C07
EITESMAVLDAELLARTLGELTVLGIRISIDDFGVGYSSFGSLSRLPIDELKIDRSFIQSMSVDQEGAAIVKAMIAMAHHLDIA